MFICMEPRERRNGRKGEGMGVLFVIFSFPKSKIPDRSSNLLEERFNLAHGPSWWGRQGTGALPMR